MIVPQHSAGEMYRGTQRLMGEMFHHVYTPEFVTKMFKLEILLKQND